MLNLSANSHPKVSVIIPAYKCDRYISQAIDSVINQTYTNWEIIVIDDGSPDNLRQVLEPYNHIIRYIYQENQGVSAARNRGIKEAEGEVIAFLDADDYFLPEKLGHQVDCFIKDPDLGIVNTGWRMVNAEMEMIADIKMWELCPELDLANWVVWKPVLPSAMMVSRQWLHWVGGFNRRLSKVEDIDLIWRLSVMGCRSTWLKEITVCYRQHDSGSMTQNPTQLAQDFDTVVNNFFARPDIPANVKKIESHSRYNYLVWLAWQFYNSGYYHQMAEYLTQSLNYTAYSSTETVMNWLNNFAGYAKGYNGKFDSYHLINLPEWRKLTSLLVC
jgi:glycosyltransferase involved in cell wall biosynthesis